MMKSILIILALVSAIAFAGKKDCVKFGYHYTGNGRYIPGFPKFTNHYTDCAKQCETYRHCKYWTWIPIDQDHDNLCYLITDASSIERKLGAISGPYNCLG